jgi:DNA repair exonuclease SbcCD ATPase subunit
MAEDPKVAPVGGVGGGAAAAVVQDPEQELAEKKKALADAKAALDALARQATGLEADVKSLETGVGEIAKALGNYEVDSKKMQDDLATSQAALKTKGDVIDPAVKDQKDKIDKVIADIYKKITDAEAAADKADKDAVQAAADYDAAAADAQAKSKAYADLKAVPQDNAAKLKTLKSLIDDIGKYVQANELAGAYYLLTVARKLADSIKIPSAADYKKALEPALEAAEAAKTTLREKKLALEDAKKKATDLRKQAVTLDASRRADTLKALKDQFGPGK